MKNQRQDLLKLLQDAYASAQNVERVLRQFGDRHASHAELVSPINACLVQTLDQQRLLGECLRRIEDGNHVAHAANTDLSALQQVPADQSADDLADDLASVRALILREMDLYASGIATAESSGFFETRLVCEEILSQKSSMAAWLSERASSQSAV